ncbi:MAG: YHS domain-containing protein [Anaerolineae bacterium]
MGLFSWLLGGDKQEEQVKMPAGAHQMQSAPMPTSEMQPESAMHTRHSESMSGMKTAKDPVCGMDVDPEKAAATSVHQGTTYYFCSPACKRTFDEETAKYLNVSQQMKQGMHGGGHRGWCC